MVLGVAVTVGVAVPSTLALMPALEVVVGLEGMVGVAAWTRLGVVVGVGSAVLVAQEVAEAVDSSTVAVAVVERVRGGEGVRLPVSVRDVVGAAEVEAVPAATVALATAVMLGVPVWEVEREVVREGVRLADMLYVSVGVALGEGVPGALGDTVSVRPVEGVGEGVSLKEVEEAGVEVREGDTLTEVLPTSLRV